MKKVIIALMVISIALVGLSFVSAADVNNDDAVLSSGIGGGENVPLFAPLASGIGGGGNPHII